jgi:hypothetical protein
MHGIYNYIPAISNCPLLLGIFYAIESACVLFCLSDSLGLSTPDFCQNKLHCILQYSNADNLKAHKCIAD